MYKESFSSLLEREKHLRRNVSVDWMKHPVDSVPYQFCYAIFVNDPPSQENDRE